MISPKERTWFYLHRNNGDLYVLAAIEAMSLAKADALFEKLLGFSPTKSTHVTMCLSKWRGPQKWELSNKFLEKYGFSN